MNDALLMPEVEAALERAVRRRRRRRPSRRAGLVAFAVLLTGGTALAQTAPWRPVLGDDHRGHPTVATGPVPAAQSAAMAVLRRPQTDADRGPKVQALLKLLPRREARGIHLDAVRLLDARKDGVTILVPMQRSGSHDTGHPSSIQRDTLCMIYGGGATGGAGEKCGTLEDLRSGNIRFSLPTVGLVPDGVARVQVKRGGKTTLTISVRNNYYDLHLGIRDGWRPVRWLDANGAVVRKTRATASAVPRR